MAEGKQDEIIKDMVEGATSWFDLYYVTAAGPMTRISLPDAQIPFVSFVYEVMQGTGKAMVTGPFLDEEITRIRQNEDCSRAEAALKLFKIFEHMERYSKLWSEASLGDIRRAEKYMFDHQYDLAIRWVEETGRFDELVDHPPEFN